MEKSRIWTRGVFCQQPELDEKPRILSYCSTRHAQRSVRSLAVLKTFVIPPTGTSLVHNGRSSSKMNASTVSLRKRQLKRSFIAGINLNGACSNPRC